MNTTDRVPLFISTSPALGDMARAAETAELGPDPVCSPSSDSGPNRLLVTKLKRFGVPDMRGVCALSLLLGVFLWLIAITSRITTPEGGMVAAPVRGLAVRLSVKDLFSSSTPSSEKYLAKDASSICSGPIIEGLAMAVKDLGVRGFPEDKAPSTVSGTCPSPWFCSRKDSLLSPDTVSLEVNTGGGGGGVAFSIAGDGTVLNDTLLEAEEEGLLGMLFFL
jgi:hypothetical protein